MTFYRGEGCTLTSNGRPLNAGQQRRSNDREANGFVRGGPGQARGSLGGGPTVLSTLPVLRRMSRPRGDAVDSLFGVPFRPSSSSSHERPRAAACPGPVLDITWVGLDRDEAMSLPQTLCLFLLMTAPSFSSGRIETADMEAGTKTVAVGELAFPVFDQGTGPVVVLLHGFPDSRLLWRSQVPALLDTGFRVVAPDLRGLGNAPKPPEVEGYAIPNVAREVIALLDALQVDDFYLVGHDWGAVVAWFLAAHYPQRVTKLVALSVGCPGTSGTRSYEQLQLAWYAFLFANARYVEQLLRADDWRFLRRLLGGHGDQERYFKELARPGALEAALNWYRANIVLNFDPKRSFSLPRIRCPVLGVWSDGDEYLAEQSLERSGENVDGPWRYEKMVGASHWMMLEKKDELNRLLLDFFQR